MNQVEIMKEFDVPFNPHKRKLSGEEIVYLAKLFSNVFNTTIENKLIESIMNYVSFIEKKMIGRIASHADDLILHYLMRYFSSLETQNTKDNICHMEIGVLFGGSVILADHAVKLSKQVIPIHVIDPFEGYYGQGKDIITKEDITENNFLKNLSLFDIARDEVIIYKGFSNDPKIIEACKSLKVASLLIDGDHSYNGVKNDWINYSHLVIPDGYILIDNYNDQYWPEVMNFINNEVLSNSNGLWKVGCFYASSLLLQRTDVSNPVNITEQSRLFQEVVTKENKLNEVQNELVSYRKVQSERIKSLEESLDKATKLMTELRSQTDSTIAAYHTEIKSLREEKEKNEIEFNKQLADFRSDKQKSDGEYKKQIEDLRLDKETVEKGFIKQIEQLRSNSQAVEDSSKKQIEQLRSDNQAVEAWLKEQIVQILTEKKNNENWLKKQIEISKQEKTTSEQKLKTVQAKYDDLNRWHKVMINSLSWKITAPIRKVKEILFPKWKG